MKNLLLITSYFSPSKNVGAIRPTKFAKYLPEFGWQPITLTLDRGEREINSGSAIALYQAKFPNPDKIFALGRWLFPRPTPRPATTPEHAPPILIDSRKQIFIEWLFIPDEEATWIPFAINKGLEIAKIHHIDAILATAMHFSCHLVGLVLSRRLNCPWLADFRDPWLTNPFTHYPTQIHRKIQSVLEGKVVNSANRVITVSEPIYRDFVERYPGQNPDKFKIVYNGYDSEDFIDLESQPVSQDIIHIVHSGSLYTGRNPLSFLQAVKLLPPTSLDKIKITFLGSNALGLKNAVEQLGLSGIVNLRDHLPYHQNLQYLSQATILLVIPGLGQGSLTTKLFEYLKLGKFILALTPSFNTAMLEVLTRANVGLAVDPDSPLEIARGLTHLIEMVETGRKIEPNWGYIQQFDRKNLTEQLAQILNEVVS